MDEVKGDELREKVYSWSLDLLEKGFRSQAIILLLATWNFAYFRYPLTRFNLKRFEATLNSVEGDLVFFKDKTFETLDLSDIKTMDSIKKVYQKLSELDEIKQVGATKVLHLLKSKVFVMWDKGILEYYKRDKSEGKINNKPEGYLNFTRLMRKLWNEGKFPPPTNGETIPRAIDAFNWENHRTTKSKA